MEKKSMRNAGEFLNNIDKHVKWYKPPTSFEDSETEKENRSLANLPTTAEELSKRAEPVATTNGGNGKENWLLANPKIQKAFFHFKQALPLLYDVVFVKEKGWHWWNYCVYKSITEEEVVNITVKRLQSNYIELIKQNPHDNDLVRKLEEVNNVTIVQRNVISLLKGESQITEDQTNPIAKSISEFDVNPYIFNTRNGFIDFSNGECRFEPHASPQPFLRVADVEYDPNADCPRFKKFLEEIMLGNKELFSYVQQFMGLTLLGKNLNNHFHIFYGGGRNGKSTFLQTWTTILGDYASPLPREILLSTKHSKENKSFGYAPLSGRRLIYLEELPDNFVLSSVVVKDLVSNDKKLVRGLYQNYTPHTFSLNVVVVTNHKPQITEFTEAMRRHVRMLPFNHKIPENEIKPDYYLTLLEEAPGILNFAITGLMNYFQQGSYEPDIIKQTTIEGFTEPGSVEHFVWTKCELNPRKSIPLPNLHQSYRDFALEFIEDYQIPNEQTFGKILKNRFGCISKRKKIQNIKTSFVIGITLRKTINSNTQIGEEDGF